MGLTKQEIQELRAERLVKLLEFYNMTAADLERKTNGSISTTNFSKWKNHAADKPGYRITEATIEIISGYFPDINELWLLGRSDYMLKTQQEALNKSSEHINARFFHPLYVLDGSIDEICYKRNIDRIEIKNQDEIKKLVDQLVTYSDFLISQYIDSMK